MLKFYSGSSANVNSRRTIRECLIRGRLSFNRDPKDEIVKRMQTPICGDKRIPWLGFYASGEFSRIGGKNGSNGFTSTICMLYRNNE